MKLKLKRTPGIYLVGFMGSGKTTIGRMYAEEIGWRFADLDDDIEAQQKATISELFERLGEEEFRRIESDAIWRRIHLIRRGLPTVLSLGGGAFTRQQNVDMLTDNGITVWIDADFDVVRRRCACAAHRPLARDPEAFERLYHSRRPFYEKAEVHVHVPGDDSRAAVKQLLELELLD
jgi:shikimate kinase